MIGSQIGGNIVWNLDVDDSRFVSGINKAKDAADKLSKNLNSQFDAVKTSAESSFKSAQDSTKVFANEVEKNSQATNASLGKSRDEMGRFVSEGSSRFSTFGNTIKKMFAEASDASRAFAGGLAGLGASLGAGLLVGLRTAGQYENLTVALETVTGSSEQARRAMDKIRKTAQESPFFETGTLASFVQLMAASGQKIDDAVNSGIKFGDVTAAFGKGNFELGRMGNTLSQVIGKGKADIVDFKELVNAGWVSVRTDVAKSMQVSMAQFEEMVSEGKIGYAEIAIAAEKYAGSAGKQAGNLTAVWNRFKETIGAVAAAIVIDTGGFDLAKRALSEIISRLEGAQGAIIEGIKTISGFIQDNIPTVIGLIAGGLAPAFGGLVAGIAGAVIALIPFIAAGAALGAIVQYVVTKMGGWDKAFSMAKDSLKALGDVYNSYIKGPLESLVNQVRNELLPSLQKLWAQLEPILIPALKTLGQWLGVYIVTFIRLFIAQLSAIIFVFTKVSDAITAFIPFAQSLPEKVGGAFNDMKNAIGDAINGTITWFTNLPGAIANAFAQMILDQIKFLGFVVGLFVYGIPEAIQATINFFTALPGKIMEYLGQLRKNLETTFTNIQTWLQVKVPETINNVVNWFATLPERLSEWFNTTKKKSETGFQDIFTAIVNEVSTWPAKLYDWGENIANSFVDGITSAIGKISDAFKKGLEDAKKFVKGNSPPVAGPFQNIDKWGFNVGSAWVEGVQSAISQLGFDSPMMAYAPAMASQVGSTGNVSTHNGPLITIESMNVRDQSDINDISRDLAFRLEMSSGYTDNG